MLGIGLYFSRSQRSVTDFWLAGRELGPLIIGFSAASSWTTASALLLATGLFLLIGVGSIWIWVFPNIAGLMIIALISKMIKNIPALTQPELMEIRYDPMIRAPVALAVTIMMILFSVTDFIGFKLVLGTFFGIDPFFAVAIMAVSVALYVMVGGFRAVVWTDLAQCFIMLGGAAVGAWWICHALGTDLVGMFREASALGKTKTFSLDFNLLQPTLWAFLFLEIFNILTWPKDQMLMQRVFATRNEAHAR